MFNLPQQYPFNQYTADGTTAIYPYTPWLALQATDIAVYVTLSGAQPNPTNDLQPYLTAYTVQNAGNLTGGTITFQAGFIPPVGAIITIDRAMQISSDTDFSDPQTFNGGDLDAAIQRITLIQQQLNVLFQQVCLSYPVNLYSPTPKTNTVPLLGANQIWIGSPNGNGVVTAQTLEENPDISILRSQLANASPSMPGAALLGFNDNGNPTTVQAKLASISLLAMAQLVNSNFWAWQNGIIFTISGTDITLQVADRWWIIINGSGSAVVTQAPMRNNNNPVAINNYSDHSMQVAFTSTGGAIVANLKMRGVATFNGQTVTITWGIENTSGYAITIDGCYIIQNFGTGGTPADPVTTQIGSKITIPSNSTNFYSFTGPVPTIQGLVVGENNDDYIYIAFSTGPYNSLLNFTFVDVDLASNAAGYVGRDYATELNSCQAFLETSFPNGQAEPAVNDPGYFFMTRPVGGPQLGLAAKFKTKKIINPTVTFWSQAGTINMIDVWTGVSHAETPFSPITGNTEDVGLTGFSLPPDADGIGYYWKADTEL